MRIHTDILHGNLFKIIFSSNSIMAWIIRFTDNWNIGAFAAMPVKRSELVLGYLTGYGIFAILQMLLIVFFQFMFSIYKLWVA